MPRPKRSAGAVGLRLNITFGENPAVYTFLSLLAQGERRRAVVGAIEKLIADTGHPAGDPDVQLTEVSRWLHDRASAGGSTQPDFKTRASPPRNDIARPNVPREILKKDADPDRTTVATASIKSPACTRQTDGAEKSLPNAAMPVSMQRWLDS